MKIHILAPSKFNFFKYDLVINWKRKRKKKKKAEVEKALYPLESNYFG